MEKYLFSALSEGAALLIQLISPRMCLFTQSNKLTRQALVCFLRLPFRMWRSRCADLLMICKEVWLWACSVWVDATKESEAEGGSVTVPSWWRQNECFMMQQRQPLLAQNIGHIKREARPPLCFLLIRIYQKTRVEAMFSQITSKHKLLSTIRSF